MKVFLNGNETEFSLPLTVAQLLTEQGLDDAPCAVEVNAVLVPKAQHDNVRITNGDRIEIVTLVGGG